MSSFLKFLKIFKHKTPESQNKESDRKPSRPAITADSPPAATNRVEGGKSYWPLDLLPDTCPNARIIAWGYDTVVTKGYKAAVHSDIFTHAKDLLYGLGGNREHCKAVGRPIIFVAHSLGGIVVKEALRRSELDDEVRNQDILKFLTAVVFLGTPHRGSEFAEFADLVRTVASVVLRLDTNDRILIALSGANSSYLQLGCESFIHLWQKYGFKVKTFQESNALTGVNIGLLNKLLSQVVPPDSSSLDDAKEHAETIDADHIHMCKFASSEDSGYRKVSIALSRFVEDATIKQQSLTPREKECLKSLVFETLESQQVQIRSAPNNTCRWLYNLPMFQKWYDRKPGSENSMLWIKGKPGCGKSVLVKSLMKTINRDRVLVEGGLASGVLGSVDAVGGFFFHARTRRFYEHYPIGLYLALVCRLFKQDPFLRERVLAEYELKTRTGEVWKDHELENLFTETYLGDEVELPLKRVFIFVDAVDECLPESWYSVVRRLAKLAQKTEFSICLSSRHFSNFLAPPNII